MKPVHCSGLKELNGPEGSLSTGPNAGPIPDPDVCRWIIRSPGAAAIALTFSDPVLRGGQIFVFTGEENVRLYAGMQRTRGFPFEASAYAVYSAASRAPAALLCPSDQVLLVFVTDHSDAARDGFALRWRAVPAAGAALRSAPAAGRAPPELERRGVGGAASLAGREERVAVTRQNREVHARLGKRKKAIASAGKGSVSDDAVGGDKVLSTLLGGSDGGGAPEAAAPGLDSESA